jgi:quinoprotein glucose dehydrogenase
MFAVSRPFAHAGRVVLALVAAAGGGWLASSSPGAARTADQLVPAPARTVRLSGVEARQQAREARSSVTVDVADGLELSLWASESLVANPIAIDFDPHGVAYVVASPRSGQLLDIRRHPDWVPEVHTNRTTEDLRQFFRRTLAPDRSAQNTWLLDLNQDGSRDWRDLTVIKERVYRLEDTNGDGVADFSRVAFEGFNDDVASDIAGGVLMHNGDLYVTAAPDLWRLRDKNRDQVFEVAESLSHGYSVHPAVSGHALSALTVGPDGRIYWKVGDIGFDVVDKTGRRWSYPTRGAVLRAEPDGTGFEVFATGLRNTQEMAFDDHGNLIGVDNDGDYPGEVERVVYITYGSDAGWRTTWQYGKYTDPRNNAYNVWMDEGLFRPRFTGQAAYIVPPIAGYRAGPSGFAFNPGTALDERWRGHFFVTSFSGSGANSRVYAFRLNERGAGFSMPGDTQILRGILSPGLKFGPDGALYLTDWMTGFGATGRGRVWKLDNPSAAGSREREEVADLLAMDFNRRPVVDVPGLMRHADMRIRQRAQFELVRRKDVGTLLDIARDTRNPLARLHALWGLGQIARVDPSQGGRLVPFLDESDPEVRAQAARVLGDIREAGAADRLMARLADESARVRFFAAEALGRIAVRRAVQPLVEMLAENDDRDEYLRHSGSLALAATGDIASLGALAGHPSRAVRLAAVVALRRLQQPAVASFLADADDLVATEAARAINDDGGIAAALPALAQMLGSSAPASDALVRRAISANLRIGTIEALERVTAFAARPTLSATIRTEALAAINVWASPSSLDRVDGTYLGPVVTRSAAVDAARRARAGSP